MQLDGEGQKRGGEAALGNTLQDVPISGQLWHTHTVLLPVHMAQAAQNEQREWLLGWG